MDGAVLRRGAAPVFYKQEDLYYDRGIMKSKKLTIILIAVFLLGIGIMLYPTISNQWNKRHSSRAIASYDEALALLGETVNYDEVWAAAEAYNEQVKVRGTVADIEEDALEQYNAHIDPVGTGMMGYIEIEKIDVRLPIYHTVDEGVLQIAVGHLPQSSLPTGGIGNHIALSGHRGLPSAKLFTDLDKMVVGDLFVLTVIDRILTYEVDQIKIVNPEEVQDLAIDPEQDYCTLITCTPYGVNSHRMLIRGHRTENVAGVTRRIVPSDATTVDTIYVAIAIAVPILVVLVIAVFVTTGKKKRK